MSSPTTLRPNVRRSPQPFADEGFLSFGDGRAGTTPYNPILPGLGMRLLVYGDKEVRSVSYLLGLADGTLFNTIDMPKLADGLWGVDGAVGAPRLGFPVNPSPNYGTPTCFRLVLRCRGKRLVTEQTYYFWVGEGPSGSIVNPADRVMSASTPYTVCVDGVPAAQAPDPVDFIYQYPTEEQTWVPSRLRGVQDQAVGLNTVNNDPYKNNRPGPFPTVGGRSPITPSTFDPGYRTYPIERKKTLVELLKAGFPDAFRYVESPDAHLTFGHTALNTASAAPGETANTIAPNYSQDSQLSVGRVPALLGLSSTINTTATFDLLLPEQFTFPGSYEYVVIGGVDAVWDGVSSNNGFELVVDGAGPALVTPSPVGGNMHALVSGGTWSTTPGSPGVFIAATEADTITVPVVPGLNPGDIMAVQVLIAPAGTFITLVGVNPLGWLFPFGCLSSNVLKLEVV